MKTVYLKPDFKITLQDGPDRIPLETDLFDGFGEAYIEGHLFVPEGMTMTRPTGEQLHGPFIQPWKDSVFLAGCQMQYEAIRADLAAAYQEGVNSL